MLGKQKCKALKEIRKQIADANEIPLVVSNCTYKGKCSGTCPKCEEELRYLEEELEKRRRLGKIVIIAGVSISACALGVKCGKEIIEPKMEEMFEEITDGNCPGAITADIHYDDCNE